MSNYLINDDVITPRYAVKRFGAEKLLECMDHDDIVNFLSKWGYDVTDENEEKNEACSDSIILTPFCGECHIGDAVNIEDSIFTEMYGILKGTYADGHYKIYLPMLKQMIYVNKFSKMTPEAIDIWNDKLKLKYLHYSRKKRMIVYWFSPYDRVVVRNSGCQWYVDFFSHYDKEDAENPYRCVGGDYSECLPYNDWTAKFVGTDKDYVEAIL